MSIVAYGTIKLGVLLLFRRIFVGKIFRIVSISMLAFVSLWTITFFFANTFECGQRPAWLWGTPETLINHCSDYKNIMLAHAVSDMVIDLIVLTIPLPIIWKLHMSTADKVGLSFVFVLGYMYVMIFHRFLTF